MIVDTKSLLSDIAATDKKFADLLKKFKDERLMTAVAQEASRIVVKRTRLGFGVDENGRKFPLERLSPGYLKKRKRMRGGLDPTTSPGKSNLTFTGQLLRSVHAQKATVRIPAGRNKKIAGYVAEQGRPFFNLSEAERSQLKRYYKNLVNGFKNL